MDKAEEICKRLELGEPLSRICKDKDFPDTSTVYRHCREDEELQKKIMNARQTGVFTLLDQIAEDMQIPKTPQETHFLREKWSHIRWLATKLASSTFGEKSKQEVKQDTTLTISWGRPSDDTKDLLQAKEIVETVEHKDTKKLSAND